MTPDREILTAQDVAAELKCSTTHVYKVIRGRVKNVSRLPAICVGRRKLVRRSSLEQWKSLNEQGNDDAMMPSPEIDAVRRIQEKSNAKTV
jgi:Helix-turn-helix domain